MPFSKALRAPDAPTTPRAQRNARTGRKASAAGGRRRRICIDPYVPEGKQLLIPHPSLRESWRFCSVGGTRRAVEPAGWSAR